MKTINSIVVVGATGLVGATVLTHLAAQGWPRSALYLVASARSAGLRIAYGDAELTVQDIAKFDFSQSDLAFFAAGSTASRDYAHQAVAAGNWVIDKSSYFRNDPQVPLVIASVNFDAIDTSCPGIIAVPNCSTIPLAMVLKPILDHYGLKRVDVATYQAVSGAGKAGVDEFSQQLRAYPDTLPAHVFAQPILNNVIASIDQLTESGYTREELKLHDESRKILAVHDLIVNATAVRVPVMQGHSEAVAIETVKAVNIATLSELLTATAHVKLLTMPDVPNPLAHATCDGTVWVGRVRQLPCDAPNRVSLWLLANNIHRGAALTAIEIAARLGAFTTVSS